jgi:hypothetical protein
MIVVKLAPASARQDFNAVAFYIEGEVTAQ